MAEIILRNVQKIYDSGTMAVKDFNLSIEKGELVVIVGPSGCGKSTLLRMLAGLESMTQGDLYIQGVHMNNTAPDQRKTAMVFQSHALFPHLTVRENIAYGIRGKYNCVQTQKLVEDTAKLLSLSQYLDCRPSALSGGQQQRVSIGRAIAAQADIILMDEPFSSLDAPLRRQLCSEIKQLHKTLAPTILYVTHDQREALTLADRLVVMEDGRILQTGTPNEIFHQPANISVASFFGDPQCNLIPGRCTHNGLQTMKGILPIQFPQEIINQQIILGFHCEDIVLEKTASSQNMAFTVQDVIQIGNDTLLYGQLGNADVCLRIPSSFYNFEDELLIRIQRFFVFDAETHNRI